MLPLLLGTAAAVWAHRTRPPGRLHQAAAVALALLGAVAVGVVVVAAAAGVLLAGLFSLVAALVLPDSGPVDPWAGVAMAVTDPMTTWTLAGLVCVGALLHRFAPRRDQALQP